MLWFDLITGIEAINTGFALNITEFVCMIIVKYCCFLVPKLLEFYRLGFMGGIGKLKKKMEDEIENSVWFFGGLVLFNLTIGAEKWRRFSQLAQIFFFWFWFF